MTARAANSLQGLHIKMVTLADKPVEDVLRKKRGNVSLAAKALSVSRTALHKYIRENSLQEIVDDAREEIVDLAEDKLLSAVRKGEAWAVCFALKTQGKERGYVERQEITINWRDKLKNAGVDPDQLFTELVAAASHRLQNNP